jgi:hypothetical protein
MIAARSPLPPAPTTLRGPAGVAFGRYRGAIASPTIEAPGALRFRLKEWHYLSIVTDGWFVALGLVQLGYAAQLFAYLVDRSGSAERLEAERLSPLGRALRFGESSVRGTTRYAARGGHVEIACDEGLLVDVDLELGGARLAGRVRIEQAPGLALVFPLSAERPAYTHKMAGTRAEGALSIGSRTILGPGRTGLAVSDFTRSLARRHTRWKWASFAHSVAGALPIGLNLSADVYDDEAGDSQENALFVGDEPIPLGGVRFVLPADPRVETWQITSRHGDEVDLRFHPLGARAQSVHLGLVRTRFVQPYGTFHGRVRDQKIDGAFGVVEDHDSLW